MSDEQEPDVTEADDTAAENPAADAPEPAAQAPEEQAPDEEQAPEAEAPAAESEAQPQPEAPAEEAPAEQPQAEEAQPEAAPAETADAPVADAAPAKEGEKPAVPGAHLEVDIVPEGADPLGREEAYADPYAEDHEPAAEAAGDEEGEESLPQPISTAAIDLAAGARYRATGKRKTAIARVTLRPGTGSYLVNGRPLEQHFPRTTLQRNIRQPLETVGYEDRMDVVARLHGGGISAQAGALRHGVSRALLEADPNLRGELKRRGFLTRDSRAKERKKAGLKKARKRPQFSKR